MLTYSKNWAKVDVNSVPDMKVPAPGPLSKQMHERAAKLMKGYSSQVRLFPVTFESGHGVTLTDVDGNTYIDFSSGIYVTGLGHCHPKVTEAVQKAAGNLMNAHDFTTPIKMKLVEKMYEISMGSGDTKLSGMQFYDSGTTAVEAGLRVMRAATGKFEFLSFHRDFHGKTMGAVGLAPLDVSQGLRAPGFFLVPRGNCYRCAFKMKHPECGLYCVDYIRTVLKEETSGRVAGIVLEPVQGWGGSVVPPEGWIQKIRALCDEFGILLMADEVLTCMARTGKMFAMEHWDTVPDVMTLGKGFGNGFPVTAMMVSEKYKEVIEKISASTSYGGNPMACAAALASIEVIQEEELCARSTHLGEILLRRMREMQELYPIIGAVRGLGCLLGIELVKDRATQEPFEQAGKLVYQKAFQKGLAWIPAGHILRMSPPMIMDDDVALKGLAIIEEAICETQKELGINVARRKIKFGLIGGGLMGREFASAAARWKHLDGLDVEPEIIAVCDPKQSALNWFTESTPSIRLATPDYRAVLEDPEVEAVYIAVQHNLHQAMYVDAIQAGKHLLAEKPFGIDQAANDAILAAAGAHPNIFVRCSSEFPYFPGAYRMAQWMREGRFGQIIEVEAGFWHSSDLDPNKPINWKRRIATCGEYGCMGDLGMHVIHLPFRAGWFPANVRALLSKIVEERPDNAGNRVACETWDNAILACEVVKEDQRFPMTLSMKRIAPGNANTWFIRVAGTALSAEFSTRNPKRFTYLPFTPGAGQEWHSLDIPYLSAYPVITGSIFEFGFSDAILQMWAAFCDELVHGRDGMRQPLYCATPQEAAQSHTLFSAALQSNRETRVVQF